MNSVEAVEALKKAHETGVLYEHCGSDREMRDAWEEATGYGVERQYYAIPEDVLKGVFVAIAAIASTTSDKGSFAIAAIASTTSDKALAWDTLAAELTPTVDDEDTEQDYEDRERMDRIMKETREKT